ncbi:hypothetical protein ACIQLJ_11925 [Microbacterium sp. NPDC091313]
MSQNTTPDNDDARRDRPADDSPTTPLPPQDAPTEQYPSHDAPAASEHAAPAASAAPVMTAEPEKKPVLRRGATWAIVGGGVVAALVLVGGGAALGAALADHDDRPAVVDGPGQRGDDGGTQGDRQGPDMQGDRQGPGGQGGPAQGGGPDRDGGPGGITGSSDAGELTGIVAKAKSADGVSGDATELEARPGGAWEVRFETTAGAETDVLVASDGTATARRTDTDSDDDAPSATLTDAAISSIVQAALDEASGTIVKIEADDDTAKPYEVTVMLTDGGRMEIDLGSDFAVVSTETHA